MAKQLSHNLIHILKNIFKFLNIFTKVFFRLIGIRIKKKGET